MGKEEEFLLILNAQIKDLKEKLDDTTITDENKGKVNAQIDNLEVLGGELNNLITLEIATAALSNGEQNLGNQKNIINSQKRMTELADYKYNKTLEYKNIMKRIVFSCIIIIGLTYAMSLPFFPSLFGKGLIILIIAYNIYYLIIDFIWNFRRDSKYWDKFNQITPDGLDADGNITLSKWEHNKRSLEKLTPSDNNCNIQFT